MAWLAILEDGLELIFQERPIKDGIFWKPVDKNYTVIILPDGTIEKIIGRKLTWEDDPVEI